MCAALCHMYPCQAVQPQNPAKVGIWESMKDQILDSLTSMEALRSEFEDQVGHPASTAQLHDMVKKADKLLTEVPSLSEGAAAVLKLVK